MASSIKKPAVVNAINAAVSAQGTVLASCQEAAEAAAKQLDTTLELKPRIDAVMDLYSDELAQDHNVKALFKDALTLFACAAAPVSLEIKKRGEEPSELHTTAKEAAKLPKHAMKEAAKQIREANGIGRQSGGGRKPKQPVSAPKQVTPAEAIKDSKLTQDAFFAQLEELLDHGRPELRQEFIAILKDHGFVCYKRK